MLSRRKKLQSGFVRPWLAATAAASATAVVTVMVLTDQPSTEPKPEQSTVLRAGISGTGNVETQFEEVAVIQYPFGAVPFSTDLVITELELKNAANTKDFRVAGISGTGDRIFIYLDNKPLTDFVPTDGVFDIVINVPDVGKHTLKFYRVDEYSKPAYSSAPITFEVQAAPSPASKLEIKTLGTVAPKPIKLASKPPRLDSFVPSLHTDNLVVLHGKGEANQKVDVLLNGRLLKTVKINTQGNWKATIDAGSTGSHKLGMRYSQNAATIKTHEVIIIVKALEKPTRRSSLKTAPKPLG